MAGMDSVGQHPLSLKVMRVSRPSLASNWEPFFSSSSSFSAHSTANPLSLQGSEPLPGHPKTLRDLTHASTLLTLPTAFGAIQLGETFSCVLSVNNEVDVPVDSVRATVEMQTSTSKMVLADVVAGSAVAGAEVEGSEDGNEDERGTLLAGDSLELAVSTEIKELGQHVLGCSVTYRTPPGMRPATSGGGYSADPFIQTFRKFYKFMVTNPLSVKSKVHVPKSPTALLSRSERDKVFLEVHIQNLTQGPLWFDKIRLEPVEGWNVIDANNLSWHPVQPEIDDGDGSTEKSIFSATTALMPPQDMRQYIYILTPKAVSRSTNVTIPPVPGTVIPLGRLDISWRSPMGEPGRLLTSVLSRRIPLPAPPSSGAAPASALPPYLQKTTLPSIPRPRSPSLQQQAQHRTATPPPQRPASPLKRSTTPGAPARPQSPVTNAPLVPPLLAQAQTQTDIQVDLVLLEKPDDATVLLEKPFFLKFSLALSGFQPSNVPGLLSDASRKSRLLTLAVQHTLPAPPPPPEQASVETQAQPTTRTLRKRTSTTLSFETTGSGIHSPASHAGSIDVLTPRRVVSPPPVSAGANASVPVSGGGESVIASPTAMAARAAGAVTVGGLTERLRRVALSEALGLRGSENGSSEVFGDGDEATINGAVDVRLPSPYSSSLRAKTEEVSAGGRGSGRVQFSGTSVVLLPPVTLSTPTSPPVSTMDEIQAPTPVTAPVARSPGTNRVERGEACVEFTLSYIPRTRGFARVGGLRVLLIRDQEKEENAGSLSDGSEEEMMLHTQGEVQPGEAQILREWDVVAELWVR